MMSTVSTTTRRRVVRRARPALDQAWDTALSSLPPEMRPLVRRYVENLKDGLEIRLALSAEMTRANLRWHQVDSVIRPLMAA
jgi:hypothetical protein